MIDEQFNIAFKEKLLDAYKFTKQFLESNGLKCYACGGTALGAVRHKGFIPWDDDIDIYMTREDYNKLIDIREKMKPFGYDFVSLETDEKYYLPFGKIVNIQTTLWEVKRLPYLLGVYIDIFPLDCYSFSDNEIFSRSLEIRKRMLKYQQSIYWFECSDYIKNLLEMHWGYLVKIMRLRKLKRRSAFYYEELLRFCMENARYQGEKCVCLPQWEGKIFKKEWFDNAVEIQFEDTAILVPSDYDKYLSLLYGDYMKLPPESERVFAHSDVRYYINLKERLTLEEANKRVKNGERCVY